MRLTRMFLLAVLLLATGTTASAKKPSRLEKYKQTIMQYLEQKPFYSPTYEYAFMYIPWKYLTANPYDSIRTSKDLLKYTIKIYEDPNDPRQYLDFWIYDINGQNVQAYVEFPFTDIGQTGPINTFRLQYILDIPGNQIQEYFFLDSTPVTTFFMVRGNQVFVSVEDGQEPFKVYLFEDYIEQFGLEPIFGPQNRYDR